MADNERTKRTRSNSGTPSPTHQRSRKTGRFDVLQLTPESDIDEMDNLSLEEVIKNTLQQNLGTAVTDGDKDSETAGWTFGQGNVASQSAKKKVRQKSKSQQNSEPVNLPGPSNSTPKSPPPVTMSDSGNLAAQIASQVVTGLVPQLTKAINAAIGAVVDKIVKQAVTTATELVGATVQRQSLLLRYELDRQEQYSRRETIRVSGIAEEENETNEQLTEKLVNMAKDCSTDITAEDISVCHRTVPIKHRDGGNRVTKRSVLCRFVSRRKKDDIMKRKKTLKNTDGDRYKYTYINDDLTFPTSKAVYHCPQPHKCEERQYTQWKNSMLDEGRGQDSPSDY